MKRTLAITATAAALALSLAGCGTRDGGMDTRPDTNAPGGTTATDTMRNDDGMTGTGTTSGASVNDDGLGSVTGAVNRGYGTRYAGGASNWNGGTNGVKNSGRDGNAYTATNNGGYLTRTDRDAKESADRYALMLENGRVHDSDGFLLDGENAHYHTF